MRQSVRTVRKYGEQFALTLEGERGKLVVARDEAFRVVVRCAVGHRPRWPRHCLSPRALCTECSCRELCRSPPRSNVVAKFVPCRGFDGICIKIGLNSAPSIFADIVKSHVRMKDRRPDKGPERATDDGIAIRTLSEKLKKSPNDTLNAIQSLERRTFPSSECLAIITETAKRNSQLLYAQSSSSIVGYLIFIQAPNGLRIHKVCIAEAFRRQGIATSFVERVCEIASKVGKDIDLWVEEARIPARECYIKCGFAQVGDTVIDYYGPGRNGIRMVWKCE